MDQVKSMRLILTTALLILIMALSAFLFINNYRQQMDDYSESRNTTLETLSRDSERTSAVFRVFSMNYNGPYVYKVPNKLGFISDGRDADLPNAFSPSAFKNYGPFKRVRSNMLLWQSEALDWSLIIGTILSFLTIILVYDAVCGEREQGTLRLIMTNSMSKAVLIIGKFTGITFGLSIALLISVLIYILILLLGGIPLTGSDTAIIALAFFISVLYIASFALIGLMVSVLSRNSTSSLVVSLMVWVVLVLVIPGYGGLTASKLEKILHKDLAAAEAQNAEVQAIQSYNSSNPEIASAAFSGHWSPGEPLERALVAADAWSASYDDYRNSMIRQVERARLLTLISPASCYTVALEAMSGSGIFHYKWFFEQISEFRIEMRNFLLDTYPHPTKWFYNYRNPNRPAEQEQELRDLVNITLDFESIPKFEGQRQDLNMIIRTILPYFLLLFLFNTVFFTVTFVRFLKYDVR